jgi:hypothetical protein
MHDDFVGEDVCIAAFMQTPQGRLLLNSAKNR